MGCGFSSLPLLNATNMACLQLRYLPTPFDAVTVVEEKGPGVRFYHPRDLHQIAEIPTVSDEEVRAITEAKQAIAAGKFVSPSLLAGQGGAAGGGGTGAKRIAAALVVAPIVNCWDVSLDRGLVAVAQVRGIEEVRGCACNTAWLLCRAMT